MSEINPVEERESYPPEGRVFELTLDGDATEIQPLEMVCRYKLYSPDKEGWHHSGPVVKGVQSRKFKLVRIGICEGLNHVQEKLVSYGYVLFEGQWLEAFRARYKPNGRNPVGVADASWTNSAGGRFFPYVDVFGFPQFEWELSIFRGYWLWLVPGK